MPSAAAWNAVDTILAIVQWILVVSFPLTVLYAVVPDIRSLKIPNWASIVITATFLPAALLGGIDLATIAIHYGIGAAVLALGTILFALGIVGGGDVKLLAAIAVWIGWEDLGLYLFLVAMTGGALALMIMIIRRFSTIPPRLEAVPWLGRDPAATQVVPYGVAIGLAAVLLYFRLTVATRAWATFLHS
jgi:prepilin peptidase CpaA